MAKIDEMALVFGNKLKKLLHDKDVSANKLSQEIGIDRASIGKYIKGDCSPRLDTFLAICNVLGVQPNYFLNPNYNDYSADNSKTEERKIIESLYCLCKMNLIEDLTIKQDSYNRSYDYALYIFKGSLLGEILLECLRYANSDLADSIEMCKKIADKYEPILINECNKDK